jgi:HJR/Mrr/RecB family endonuclease
MHSILRKAFGRGQGQKTRLARGAVYGSVGFLALVVFVLGLLYAASQLGLDPQAFVLAVFAGLVTLIAYAVLLAALFLASRRIQQEQRLHALQIADIDRMDGAAFEQYVVRLLNAQGYQTEPTGHSGDLGVDIVARQSLLRYAIQVKRQKAPVSRRAVSDAVAGMAQYDCNAAMVVTSGYFSPGALELARSNHCVLIDRDQLADWIMEFQS